MESIYGISVKEFTELEILKNSKVLAGEGGLSRTIIKVNIMEVPDIADWVQEKEFILTTAYSLKDDVQKFKELICKLNKKGVSGIGIKTKRYIQEVPENILKTADKLNFPLIELPYDISFSDIITPALTKIVNKQADLLKKTINFNQKIINTKLKGGGLDEIAQVMYENIGNSICISENLFKTNIIACNKNIREQIEDIVVNCNFNKKALINIDFNSNLNTIVIDKIDEKEVKRIVIPIQIDNRNYGNIYIWEDNKKLTLIEMNVIQSSLSIIALELMRKMSIFSIESRQKIEFFYDLFSKDKNKYQQALEKAYYYNFDKKLSYCVIVIKIRIINIKEKNIDNNFDLLGQINEKLLSIVERTSRIRKEKILYGGKSDKIIILFGEEKDKEEKQIKRNVINFSNEIVSFSRTDNIEKNISIGIGRNYKDTDDLWRSYEEAKRAADSYKLFQNNMPIHYDDLGLYRILSFEEIQPELIKLCKEILGSLIKYDIEKGSELIDTLENYFIYAGNLKKVSEAMYIHYNTIIYRINRIEEITGLKLDNYNNSLNVQISLKVYDMLKTNNMLEIYF